MQLHTSRLEKKLRDGEFSYPLSSDANDEVEELVVKYTRAKTAVTFDRDGFFDVQKRYASDPAYREEIEAKIAGTWEAPKKEKKPKAAKVVEETVTEQVDNVE